MNFTFHCDKLKLLFSQQYEDIRSLLCIIFAIYGDSVEESPTYIPYQKSANIFCEGLSGVNILALQATYNYSALSQSKKQSCIVHKTLFNLNFMQLSHDTKYSFNFFIQQFKNVKTIYSQLTGHANTSSGEFDQRAQCVEVCAR